MIDGRPKLYKLCIIMTCPRCRLCIIACSISGVKEKYDGPEEERAKTGS